MKKTVFYGTINGENFSEAFNNVVDYNTRISELLEKGITFNASTKTETVDVCSTCGNENCTCTKTIDDSELFPYFITDTYYLDDLTSSSISDEEIRTHLNSCRDTISSYLADKNISQLHKQEYFDKVLDIRKMLQQDKQFNDKAITALIEKRNEILKTYNAAKEQYIEDNKQCDIEDNILGKANKFIETLKQFYDDIAKQATLVTCFDDNKCNGCTCTSECNGECSCNSKECKCNTTTFTEKTKPKVQDVSKLFNKIFGVTLDELKKPY